ncbi:hypothetical protein CC79DRAFT_684659 [Sarocladium strictum]
MSPSSLYWAAALFCDQRRAHDKTGTDKLNFDALSSSSLAENRPCLAKLASLSRCSCMDTSQGEMAKYKPRSCNPCLIGLSSSPLHSLIDDHHRSQDSLNPTLHLHA